MDIGVIAKRYAKALLLYAIEQKSEDAVYKEILQLISSYREVPQLSTALSNPLLPNAEKVEVICKAACGTSHVTDAFQKFATLVVAHHRESFMLFIANNYVTLYRAEKHLSIGKLITAVPASEEVSSRLRDMVEKTAAGKVTVALDTVVDPSILGGFIFQIDDLRLDASVRQQFDTIKKQFIEKNKRIV